MKFSKKFWRSLLWLVMIAALCGVMDVPLLPSAKAAPVMQATTSIVINQVYGGGGNSGAPYTNDYIELFNPSASSVSINGWSLQYASATGTTWNVITLPNFSIGAGQYFLVQLGSGGSVGSALPTPNATSTVDMSATAGKVALVNTTTSLN